MGTTPSRFRAALAALVLAAAGLLAGCGAADAQDRPEVVSTWPPALASLAGPLREIRVTWDEPVRVLNRFDLRVFDGGVLLNTTWLQPAGDPNSIHLLLANGTAFPQDTVLVLQVVQGAVVNAQDHYAADEFVTSFTTGIEPPLAVARSGHVTLLDPFSFLALDNVPTPAGTDPVGLVSTARDGVRRIWVQLDNGGGAGEALAWFEPGAATMNTISLPTTGGDLLAEAPAIAVGAAGRYVYAAYREDMSELVRVVRIDTDTAALAGTLDLASVRADGATMPTAAVLADDVLGARLYVAAEDGATGTVAEVATASFTEVDTDPAAPGVQGRPLLAGAGPTASLSGRLLVLPPGGNDATLVPTNGDPTSSSPSPLTGTPVDVLGTRDMQVAIEGLAGFAGTDALQLRLASSYATPTAFTVSDDVGGAPQGISDVVAMQWLNAGSSLVVLFDAGGRLLLGLFEQVGAGLEQIDLDDGTTGTQLVDVSAEIPGAYRIGRSYGTFAP